MSISSRAIILGALSAALLLAPAMASADTLPAFSTDIVPIGLTLTIVDQKVTTRTATTESATFTINTGFTSSDFTEDLIDLTSGGGPLQVGVAPNGSCRTGETILPPLSILMADVIHTPGVGEDSFSFTGTNFSADWTITQVNGSSGGSSNGGGGNSSVSCINGDCTVTGSGGSTIISNNGSVIIQNNSVGGSSGGPTPTDQMTFKATADVGGIIPLPQTAVDVFFLYPGDRDADDPSGSSSSLEGGCITLHSVSVNNQTRSINGKTTVTRTYAAH